MPAERRGGIRVVNSPTETKWHVRQVVHLPEEVWPTLNGEVISHLVIGRPFLGPDKDVLFGVTGGELREILRSVRTVKGEGGVKEDASSSSRT